MKQYNEGTKIIIKDLLILKDKVIMCGMPDYNYILMGINIVEEFVLNQNPMDISNESLDNILDEIKYNVENNAFGYINYGVFTGIKMGYSNIEKKKTKELKK